MDILIAIIQESKLSKSFNTASVLKLIGTYKMIKESEKSWAGKIFNKDQLKKFLQTLMFDKQNLSNV